MARGVNKVILVGTLGKDPEVKYMPSGGAIVNISVATSESWKDKNTGEKKELTEWHRVSMFNQLAEIAGKYLSKGQQVYLEGKLKTRKYQKDGSDHYVTEIIADTMQMIGSRQDGGGQSGNAPQQQQRKPAAKPQQQDAFEDFEDDIPFN